MIFLSCLLRSVYVPLNMCSLMHTFTNLSSFYPRPGSGSSSGSSSSSSSSHHHAHSSSSTGSQATPYSSSKGGHHQHGGPSSQQKSSYDSRSPQQLDIAKALLDLPGGSRSPARGGAYSASSSQKSSPSKSRSPATTKKKMSSSSPGEREGYYPCNRCGRYAKSVCVQIMSGSGMHMRIL
jgi:hypothetical protein